MSTSKSAQDSACVVKGSQISSEAVNRFIATPEALLTKYSSGGGGLSGDVRDLVVTDPKTLDPIIALISKSNAAQKSAIGTGLGLAVSLCQKTQPDFSATIQKVAAVLKDATGSIASNSSEEPGHGRHSQRGRRKWAIHTIRARRDRYGLCLGGEPTSSETVNKLIETPEELLNKYRSGGGGLTAEVRDLVTTDSRTLDPIIALISKANITQKASIGAGLGLAAALMSEVAARSCGYHSTCRCRVRRIRR